MDAVVKPLRKAQLSEHVRKAPAEPRPSREEAEALRTLVRDLSRGMELNPSLAVRQIAAPVIGYGSDLSGGLLTVRAGRKDGVEPNSVVVVRGVYLVGRVQRVRQQQQRVGQVGDIRG